MFDKKIIIIYFHQYEVKLEKYAKAPKHIASITAWTYYKRYQKTKG